MTVLSRNPDKLNNLPTGVSTRKVDYSSVDSLTSALQGQDAVVATLGAAGILGQKTIIDASINAGVKRYIPSDWGSITTDPKARSLPQNYPLIQIQEYLKEKADKGDIEYTILSIGGFLDLLLDMPFLLDISTSTIDFFDKGRHPFSVTTLAGVGTAVVGVLKAPAETKNRNLFVHEAILTQEKIVNIVKRHSPPGKQWREAYADAEEEFQKALENAAKDPTDFSLILPLLKASLLGGKFDAAYSSVDNGLVGLSVWDDDRLESMLATKLREKTSDN